jgi:hypothetical protein
MFDKNHIDEIYNIGYETAFNRIKELEKSSLLFGSKNNSSTAILDKVQ